MFNLKLKTLFNSENKNTTNNQSKVLDDKLIDLLSNIEKNISNFKLDKNNKILLNSLNFKLDIFLIFSWFWIILSLFLIILTKSGLIFLSFKSIISLLFLSNIITILICFINHNKINNNDLLIKKSFSVLIKMNEKFNLSKNSDFQYVFKINYDYLHNKKILSNNNKKNIFKENLNFIHNYFINKNDNGENLKNIIDNYKG